MIHTTFPASSLEIHEAQFADGTCPQSSAFEVWAEHVRHLPWRPSSPWETGRWRGGGVTQSVAPRDPGAARWARGGGDVSGRCQVGTVSIMHGARALARPGAPL